MCLYYFLLNPASAEPRASKYPISNSSNPDNITLRLSGSFTGQAQVSPQTHYWLIPIITICFVIWIIILEIMSAFCNNIYSMIKIFIGSKKEPRNKTNSSEEYSIHPRSIVIGTTTSKDAKLTVTPEFRMAIEPVPLATQVQNPDPNQKKKNKEVKHSKL